MPFASLIPPEKKAPQQAYLPAAGLSPVVQEKRSGTALGVIVTTKTIIILQLSIFATAWEGSGGGSSCPKLVVDHQHDVGDVNVGIIIGIC